MMIAPSACRQPVRTGQGPVNRHREGYTTYLEEPDAQRTLFCVEHAAVQLRADLLAAQVNLYHALGGGWRP